MEQTLSFDYDMATMALKGKRFREAEEKFRDLAMRTNSVEAWCGIALSKFGLIMDDTSVAEVFYCFDKARSVSTDENRADLLTVIQQSSFECASHLYDLYINAVLATRSAVHKKNAAMVSTIVSGFSTLNAASQNKTIGTIASAAFTGLSYDSYLKSHSTVEELKLVQDDVVKIIEEIKGYMKLSLGETSDKWKEFVSLTEQRQRDVIEALKTEDQKAYEKAKADKSGQTSTPKQISATAVNMPAEPTAAQKEKLKYLEEKREELKDPNHPFHLSKAEAQRLFNGHNYKDALRYANLAATYFNEDEDVKAIQDKVTKRRIRLTLVAVVPLWLFVAGFIGVSLNTKSVNLTLGLTGIPFLAYLFYKSHQLKTGVATVVELQTKQTTKLN